MARYFVQDPSDNLDYVANWASFLEDAGSPADTISTSTWSVTPLDASPGSPTLSNEAITVTQAIVYVADVEAGSLYRLTNRIVTTLGRTAEQSMTLRGEDK